jgi:phenylacetic acid degradation protein paaN
MPSTAVQAALELFDHHRATLDRALLAISERGYWSPYSEHLKQYPEAASQGAQAAFEKLLGKHFALVGPAPVGRSGNERSPYGFDLGISYDQYDAEALLERQQQALSVWRDAGARARVGVCLEILQRLNALSPTLAHAVMHTTGQAFMMAFQAGGAHAQDRGLEAVAYAWRAMAEVPEAAQWVKPQGKLAPLQLDKRWHVVPRGLALVVACSTFPTWNTYPGLFASLATGNPVLVKAHPAAILPVAMSVKVAQEVLSELGFDPALVSLVVDTAEAPVAQLLALDPRIKLVDFTGSNAFGEWLERHALQAQVFTEKAGINSIIIDSTYDLNAVAKNLAFSLSLYSGQMCTTTQAIYVPRGGIRSGDEHFSFDQVAEAVVDAIQALLADNDRACAVLGAIQSEATSARIDACRELGDVLLDSEVREHPQFHGARVRTPLLLKVDAADRAAFGQERFGPITFLIATNDSAHSLQVAREVIATKGAMTLGVYSTDEAFLDQAEVLAQDVAVALSVNLDGSVFVNQSAAFSDFHASGGNPAANASITDGAFVSRRFVTVQSRRHVGK